MRTSKAGLAGMLAASAITMMGSGTRGWQRARGPGWTNAHAKRVARKARAVKAHRARSRG